MSDTAATHFGNLPLTLGGEPHTPLVASLTPRSW